MEKMDSTLENRLVNVAVQIEKQLNEEIEKLNDLDTDDINDLREARLREMKEHAKQKQIWVENGHGIYSEIAAEKEFFEASKKSEKMICHFFKNDKERCKIVDKHLYMLASKHVEAKFCKINAEKCPYLTERLRIKVIPTIALIQDSKTIDYIVGFADLGNRDEFSTAMMEWRIARSGVIGYDGDLQAPPGKDNGRKTIRNYSKRKTIRNEIKDSDSDFE